MCALAAPEGIQRLNHEAAKAVRYGGIDPHEALKFLTINPATLKRLDDVYGKMTREYEQVIGPILAHNRRGHHLLVPGVRSSNIHIVDTATDPRSPRLHKVILVNEHIKSIFGYSEEEAGGHGDWVLGTGDLVLLIADSAADSAGIEDWRLWIMDF